MTNASVVTFDVADGSFTFYSKESWEITIEEWRRELVIEGYLDAGDEEELDYYEVVELLWGDEMFIDFITAGSVK